MVSGLLMMAFGYVLYPTATSVEQLIVYRIVFSAGVAAATGMLGTITHDYPQEISRGRTVAISGIMIIIGSTIVALSFSRLPVYLTAQGLDGVTAGQFTFWSAAACVALASIVLRPRISSTVIAWIRSPRIPTLAISSRPVSGSITRPPRITVS